MFNLIHLCELVPNWLQFDIHVIVPFKYGTLLLSPHAIMKILKAITETGVNFPKIVCSST